MNLSRRLTFAVVIVFLLCFASVAEAQEFGAEFFQSLSWRGIGPYRGGRTRAVAGVPGQPNLFYIGVVNGGVWKTTDAGRTWTPIFDDQPTGSIGAIAVAPSDSKIIYVGSGEGLHRPDLSVGDGIYKSTDAGKSWTHLGLRDGQQIAQIAVDPRDTNRLLVAVAGHPYGPNDERGIFRSTDGGQTFQKVLYKDENTGGADVKIDPANPEIVYASLWEAREGPWENAAWNGGGGGIFKSTDGGQTWRPLTKGLPEEVVQANIAIARSVPNWLFAAVASKTAVGLYRSDDAGDSWTKITNDARPAGRIGGGDLPNLMVDPKDPETVYVTSTVTWKSTDGGKSWIGFRGAPGGDDYQNIWINPDDPAIILLASDQGAIVTVNGGQSWSSWYNQPTAQLYHVNADNAFPYRLCSGQQESGSVCIASRGSAGQITVRDWQTVAAEEYGYVVPDPLDPDMIYGGKLTRFDRRAGQAQNILPEPFRSAKFRILRTEPVVFSSLDPHVLYFASNVLWKTRDGGRSWQQSSPDLTRTTYDVSESVGKYKSEPNTKPMQRGVIYAVAPSPLDANLIWAGTDDGLVHLTTDDGEHWTNVSPEQLKAWEKVSIIEAGHFDAQTAYAAINTLRLDDLRPRIYRTHDSGKNWTAITNGIPNGENVNAVREDPLRKGMLFAGTERAVYVSLDDGNHWQSLRRNMPATSVRDLLIKNDDLIAATHGRGFWIMDNITPLRLLDSSTATAEAVLFKPQLTYRVRWNLTTDTPLPPDEPAGPNPPDGAMIDYYLSAVASGPVTLEVRDSDGNTVRRYSSTDNVEAVDPAKIPIPDYWIRPPQALSSAAGMHRFLWDMRLPPVAGIEPNYPISAVLHNLAPEPTSPWALPGEYTVALTVNGKSYSQPLTIQMDPRVKIPASGLRMQFALSKQLYEDIIATTAAMDQIAAARKQVAGLVSLLNGSESSSKVDPAQKKAKPGAVSLLDELNALAAKLLAMEGEVKGRPARGSEVDSLASLRASQLSLLGVLQDVDDEPTAQATAAAAELGHARLRIIERWQTMKTHEIAPVNTQLRKAKLAEVKTE